jgi:antitoxin ParD1/3/4
MDRELTITVSDEDARFIEEQIRSGAFASASDMVRAGFDELRLAAGAPGEEIDPQWLRAKVQEALDDPRPPVSNAEVRARIEAWYQDALRRHERS